MPLLATNIHRDHPQGGFTIPYITDWNQNALSLQQSMAWADCEHARYGLLACGLRGVACLRACKVRHTRRSLPAGYPLPSGP